jgi:hypothetical protein
MNTEKKEVGGRTSPNRDVIMENMLVSCTPIRAYPCSSVAHFNGIVPAWKL